MVGSPKRHNGSQVKSSDEVTGDVQGKSIQSNSLMDVSASPSYDLQNDR